MPKPKLIWSPDLLWSLFVEYKTHCKKTPIKVQDFVGKDGDEVFREKERCLTMEGFENFVADKDGMPMSLEQYFSNTDKRYSEYIAICSRIRRQIRQDQIEGGMAGIYNPSITQRLNGLVDKTDTNLRLEQSIFKELDINTDVHKDNSTGQDS